MHVFLRDGAMNLCRGVEDLRIFYGVGGIWLITFTLVSSNLFKIRIFGPYSIEIQYPPVDGN
ncbi:phenylalanyl-tRNA synthetase [Sesbania bispinosa]|nr:phenylalanyl-tRNA synthetase [Sesbania bispinosa]